MLFYDNLEEIIFHRHELFPSDELIILSGYVGPNPVSRLSNLPLKTKVIYGMYGTEGIRQSLHNSLLALNKDMKNTTILYSNIPVHSKCYIWKNKNSIVHALVGSANFSTNGLSNPFKEVLAETTHDTFSPLNSYLNKILDNCVICSSGNISISVNYSKSKIPKNMDTEVCNMTLLDPRTDEVPDASGLNWGQGNAHNKPNDAYIAIRSFYIINYPKMFPPKQKVPIVNNSGRHQRQNDAIEIIWDDGTTMEGLLEGNLPIDGVMYPKQISSSPEKSLFGEYIRKRIGKSLGEKIYKKDLDNYGRVDISVSLQSEGVYYFDFSTNK